MFLIYEHHYICKLKTTMLQTFFQYVGLPPQDTKEYSFELGLKILLKVGDVIRSCVRQLLEHHNF